jgi:hypothetical protein
MISLVAMGAATGWSWHPDTQTISMNLGTDVSGSASYALGEIGVTQEAQKYNGGYVGYLIVGVPTTGPHKGATHATAAADTVFIKTITYMLGYQPTTMASDPALCKTLDSNKFTALPCTLQVKRAAASGTCDTTLYETLSWYIRVSDTCNDTTMVVKYPVTGRVVLK